MSAEEFLASTPVEIDWKVEAHNDAISRQTSDYWMLGKLVGIAVNDPKNYPSLSAILPTQTPPKPPPAEMTDTDARRDILSMQP